VVAADVSMRGRATAEEDFSVEAAVTREEIGVEQRRRERWRGDRWGL
jgi:hypothetical protein